MEEFRYILRTISVVIVTVWVVRYFLRRYDARRRLRGGGAFRSGSDVSTPGAARDRQRRNLRSEIRGDLNPGQFAPLSRDETLRIAKGLGATLNMTRWIFRRDLIPPTSDDRTLLIDRSMVGAGLVTPDELARLHEIGDRMIVIHDKVVAAQSAGALAGEAAVKRDQEERQERRQRRIAEAAERRRKHAEAVLQRKREDIIYLGRGVSSGLADRRADVEKLTRQGLPVLCTPADVAKALQLSISRLRFLAFHSEAPTVTHYVRFTVPKRGGGVRELAAPHADLSGCQHWILDKILNGLEPSPAAHGFVRARSVATNAKPHVGHDVVVNADLKDFFPSITFPRVRGVFEELGFSPAAAVILALLCTESPRTAVAYNGTTRFAARGPRALPQGACTSPALSNYVARRLDARLAGIARRLGWTYTRYADDLTFSASGADPGAMTGYLLARVRHIAQDEGFAVNENKTRVQRQSRRQTVTGIVVNRRPGISRMEVRRLRALLHNARRTGLAAQNREGRPDFVAWLRGKIAWINMVNPGQGAPLLKEFAALTGQEPRG